MPTPTLEEHLGAGLLAYWLASDLTAGDGNAVASWTDRVNSIDMAQATASKRPLQIDNYASTGYAAAEFDGTDDSLEADDVSLDVTKFAILMAVKQASPVAVANTAYCVGNASTFSRIMANSTTIGDFRLQNGSTSSTGAASGSTDINVIAARFQSDGYFWIQNGSGIGSYGPSLTINSDQEQHLGSRGGTQQYFRGGILAAAFVDLNVCSWHDVLGARVIMRNNFGLTLYDQLPETSGGSTLFIPIED